jgi:hypothetical protein
MEEFGNFIGKHHSAESNEKNRKFHKLNPNKSLYSLGIKKSDETKHKISMNRIGKNIGPKHPNWKGGITKVDKSCRGMSEYSSWRTAVFVRDNFTCVGCGVSGVYITAHHKKSFSMILKENNITTVGDARVCEELWDISNGKTLCEKCHSLTDNYRGRLTTKNIKKIINK